MKYSKQTIFLLVVAMCMTVAGQVWADGIKDRMTQRLPVIADLKDQGIVGETNEGYLGFVTGQQVNADVVAAENKDRQSIYVHIAGQQGVSVELVQKRRASVLADRARSGHYIQDAAGKWIKK